MTHSGGKPHTNIGDTGMRWEVQYFPADGGKQKVFGWASGLAEAEHMLKAVCLWPMASGGIIVDRAQGIIALKRMKRRKT